MRTYSVRSYFDGYVSPLEMSSPGFQVLALGLDRPILVSYRNKVKFDLVMAVFNLWKVATSTLRISVRDGEPGVYLSFFV